MNELGDTWKWAIAPPGQAHLSKLATTKSLERQIRVGFSVLAVMKVSQAGDRPSWPGGRTERLEATLRSLLLARRVVVRVQKHNLPVDLNNHPALRAPLLSQGGEYCSACDFVRASFN